MCYFTFLLQRLSIKERLVELRPKIFIAEICEE